MQRRCLTRSSCAPSNSSGPESRRCCGRRLRRRLRASRFATPRSGVRPGAHAFLTAMREIVRYRQLDQTQITQTLRRLRDRIAERFPESGLANVGAELVSLSDEAFACVTYVRRPNWPIRVAVGVVIAAMITVVGL